MLELDVVGAELTLLQSEEKKEEDPIGDASSPFFSSSFHCWIVALNALLIGTPFHMEGVVELTQSTLKKLPNSSGELCYSSCWELMSEF